MEIKNLLPEINRNDYQLDNFFAFLKKVGFSYNIPSIHIAGTNGKGSTANFLYNIYKENNYKVGLFTSPSFKDTNDMIIVDGNYVPDEFINTIIDEYKKSFIKFNLSLFEIIAFIAFKYFISQACDIAIIECCMGGELDATNIFTPIMSVITSVSIEHSQFLGSSINSVALHKSGIIKYGIPVVIGNLNEEAELTISKVAKDLDVLISKLSPASNIQHHDDGIHFSYMHYIDIHIPYFAEYEIDNCCIALEVITKLNSRYKLDYEKVKKGIQKSNIPARFEVVKQKPIVICDGAHNPEAIHKLISSIEKNFNKEIHIVFASFKDKNISIMLPDLSRLTKDITITTFDHVRCRTEEDYFLFLEEYKFDNDYRKVIKDYINTYPDDIILITGSLGFAYLVSNDFKSGVFNG